MVVSSSSLSASFAKERKQHETCGELTGALNLDVENFGGSLARVSKQQRRGVHIAGRFVVAEVADDPGRVLSRAVCGLKHGKFSVKGA